MLPTRLRGKRGRIFNSLASEAGLHGFRFHDLRHTTGSRITKARGLALAKKLLGHRSIDTTLRYSLVLTEDVAEAMDSVSCSGPEKKEPGAQARPSAVAFGERENPMKLNRLAGAPGDGAGEGNRTLDIQLGKLSFYH